MKRNILILVTLCFLVGPILSQNTNTHDLVIAEGSLTDILVHGPGLENNYLNEGSNRRVNIYLPPGYETAPNTRYPVIYLLHGYNCSYTTFFERKDYGFNLRYILDTLINRNLLTPVIVASPDVLSIYGGGWYTNSVVTGNWEDFIVQDLVNYMDDNYRTLSSVNSRGIAGHSMGGYGTFKIAMKHSDRFCAAYSLSGVVSLEHYEIDFKSRMLQAIQADNFNELDVLVQLLISMAAAFAPDTAMKPFYGQIPISTNGEVIDSVWQKWLANDPYSMISAYKDSILSLNALQFDCGKSDKDIGIYDENVRFSQALIDHGIEHVFLEYDGNHYNRLEERMRDHMLPFFSKHLDHTVPGISRKSASYLENTDTLVVEMDQDGSVHIVPENTMALLDSIIEYQIASSPAKANSRVAFPLVDIELGEYILYGIDESNNFVSIPLPFMLVENTSPPVITLAKDTIMKGDTIFAKSDKDGTLYLVTMSTTPENIHTRPPKGSSGVVAGVMAAFPTVGLAGRNYLLYAEDKYGFLSEAKQIILVEEGTGIGHKIAPEIKLYPNPARELLTIQTKGIEIYLIEIASLNGQLLFSSEMEGTTRQIDLSSFPKGVFFITLRAKDFVTTRKIIKL
jgi:S-formylglutathione hydrolase